MANSGAPRYHFNSVDDLLHEAGRTRNKKHSQKRGFEMDHVVELQLVKAALNQVADRTYNKDSLAEIVDFFNGDRNLRELPGHQNRLKGEAVTRLILGTAAQAGDAEWIQRIQSHWKSMRKQLQGFIRFKNAMNIILKVQ